MTFGPEPPEALSRAVHRIDGMQGVVLDDRPRSVAVHVWRVQLSLTPPGLKKGRGIPATTRWVVLVEGNYPYGAIEFYPARDGGITATYPHQLANRAESGSIHTNGKICQSLSDGQLGRLAKTPEPMGEGRLAWHVQRAMAWLEAASKNELTAKGDHWEKPDFAASGETVIHLECAASFGVWRKSAVRTGFADLVRHGDKRFIGGFRDRDGNVVLTPAWGSWLSRTQYPPRAPWILLPDVPVRDPWQAPFTWLELREACRDQGIDLDAELAPLIEEIRPRTSRKGRKRRRGRPTSTSIALVGFPIKRVIGGPDVLIHWQALRLPWLTEASTRAIPGFRVTTSHLWAADRQTGLADRQHINWLRSENWHIEQVSSRGSLTPVARDRRLAVIGAGVLGSSLCELLARTGLWQFVLVDPERFEGGNLSRHTLTLEAVKEQKAIALAHRLELINPRIAVQPITRSIDDLTEDEWRTIDDCDAILDTTGSDAVIDSISRHGWPSDKLFVSASLSADADRMFLFGAEAPAFPGSDFFSWLEPIMESERKRVGPLPMEGVGCWYPVSPARYDRIVTLTGLVIPLLERWLGTGLKAVSRQVVKVPVIA